LIPDSTEAVVEADMVEQVAEPVVGREAVTAAQPEVRAVEVLVPVVAAEQQW